MCPKEPLILLTQIFDTGNHFDGTTACFASCNINVDNPFQAYRPGHRGVTFCDCAAICFTVFPALVALARRGRMFQAGDGGAGPRAARKYRNYTRGPFGTGVRTANGKGRDRIGTGADLRFDLQGKSRHYRRLERCGNAEPRLDLLGPGPPDRHRQLVGLHIHQ